MEYSRNFIREPAGLKQAKKRLFTIRLCLFLLLSVSSQAAHDYGFMYINGGTVETTGLSNASWHVVGSGTGTGDDFTEGSVSNWEASTVVNRLKVTTGGAGSYHVTFTLSFEGSVTDWSVGISKNNATPTNIYTRSISNSNKDAGSIGGSVDLAMSEGDSLVLMVKPADNTQDFKPIHAQIAAIEALDVGSAPLGSMHLYNGTTTISTLGTSFVPITGLTEGGEMNGVSELNDSLLIGSGNSGAYFVSFHVSFSGDGTTNPGQHWIGAVESGEGRDPTSIIATRRTLATDVGVMAAEGIMNLTAGSGLRLEMKADGPNTDITIKYINVIIIKLSGVDTAPPHASMSISSDQKVPIDASSTWYQVGTFTSGSLSSAWTYNADTLRAVEEPAAGIYYAKYSLSFKSSDAVGAENIMFGLFVGRGGSEVEHLESTVERMISSNTDIGSIQGVALLDITSVDSAVVLKVKNLTNTDTITVVSATVNLYRMSATDHDGSLPVELMYFTGVSKYEQVHLEWETGSEIENLGFILERRLLGDTRWNLYDNYLDNPSLLGQGSTPRTTKYQFVDKNVDVGRTYEYRLSDVDYTNTITRHKSIKCTVRAQEDLQQPAQVTLQAAYPNPFNPSTILGFTVDVSTHLNFTIYDVLGNEVYQVADGLFEPGVYSYQWNGMDETGQQVGTGIYFAKLLSNDGSKVTKLTYLN